MNQDLKKNYVIFIESSTVNLSIKKYILCCLFCIKHNYEFINYTDFIKSNNVNDFTFYQGLDIISEDITYIPDMPVDELKKIVIANNFYAFNTLGFIKKEFDIKNLMENNFINKKTEHGIYVRNTININQSNYNNYLNKKINNNLFFKQENYVYNIELNNIEILLSYINSNNDYIYLNKEKILIKNLINKDIFSKTSNKYISFKQNSISSEINLNNYLLGILLNIKNNNFDIIPYTSICPFEYDKITIINELNYLDYIQSNQQFLINNLLIEGPILNSFDSLFENKELIIKYLMDSKNQSDNIIIDNNTYLIKNIINRINVENDKKYDLVINIKYDSDNINKDFYKKFCLIPMLKSLNLFNKNIMIIYKNKDRIINKTIDYLKLNNNVVEFNGNDDIDILEKMSNSRMIITYNNLFYLSKIFNPEQIIYLPYDINKNNKCIFGNNIKYFDITNTKKSYICGCVKNCEPYLDGVFNNFEKISKLFNETKIIISYDHSTDNTLEKLNELKKRFVDMEILINNNARSSYNTHNIANARNLIMKYIKNDDLSDEFDYFINIDMDNVSSSKINIDNFNMYFNENILNQWDCLTFNKNDYYDIWALSIDNLIYSCWHFNNPELVIEKMKKYLKYKFDNSKIYDLIDCVSAFNGFGIYKKNKFINCEYVSNIFKSIELIGNHKINENIGFLNNLTKTENFIHTSNFEDCEHRYFHLSAIKKNNSKIKISPLSLFDSNYENNCKLVSSRGILKSCDIKSFTPMSSTNLLINYDFSSLKDGSIIYVCNYGIKNFVDFINKIPYKIILVSGDSDCTIDLNFFNGIIKFIENPKIIHWFPQNCLITHPKVTGIPIGLDFHTMNERKSDWGDRIFPINQEELLFNIKNSSKPFYERKIKCYSNFHFFTNTKYGYDRIDAINKLKPELIEYEKNKVNRDTTWRTQSEYAFVISPHGNGLDCHRTWEALCLGCIPVVKKSGISYLYDELPVLIVDEWDLVTQELLVNTVQKFKNTKFNYDKLNLEYWVKIIRSKV